MSSDEVLKHALGSHAFEHFEAASYCSQLPQKMLVNPRSAHL